jgi:hypothetical protein
MRSRRLLALNQGHVKIEGREQFDDSDDRGRHRNEPEVGGRKQVSEYDHAH